MLPQFVHLFPFPCSGLIRDPRYLFERSNRDTRCCLESAFESNGAKAPNASLTSVHPFTCLFVVSNAVKVYFTCANNRNHFAVAQSLSIAVAAVSEHGNTNTSTKSNLYTLCPFVDYFTNSSVVPQSSATSISEHATALSTCAHSGVSQQLYAARSITANLCPIDL